MPSQLPLRNRLWTSLRLAWQRLATSIRQGAAPQRRVHKNPDDFDPRWIGFLAACEAGSPSQEVEDGILAGWHLSAFSQEDMAHPTAMHLAARAPDPHALTRLLDAGAPMDELDEEGLDPLGQASRQGSLACMEELIGRGAYPDPSEGRSSLNAACEGSQPAAVDLLLARFPMKPGRGARHQIDLGLAWACRGWVLPGRIACVRKMLALGANPDTQADGLGPPLLWSCEHGDPDEIQALLDAGADPRVKRAFDGTDAFMWAARTHSKNPAGALLVARHGCPVDGVRGDGRTALMFAAHGGMVECLDAALAAGGDPRAVDKGGDTALHFAALSGSLECVERLMALGADVDSIARERATPMWRAAQVGSEEIFMALTRAGADPFGSSDEFPTNFEHSAFAMAARHGWTDALWAASGNGMARSLDAAAPHRREIILACVDGMDPAMAASLRARLLSGTERQGLRAQIADHAGSVERRRL